MVLCTKYAVFCVGIYLAYIVCALSGAHCPIARFSLLVSSSAVCGIVGSLSIVRKELNVLHCGCIY